MRAYQRRLAVRRCSRERIILGDPGGSTLAQCAKAAARGFDRILGLEIAENLDFDWPGFQDRRPEFAKGLGSPLSAIAPTLLDGVVGIIAGAVVLAVVIAVKKLLPKKK